MAEVLKEFDWDAAPSSNLPKPTYHWEDWFNGDIWMLTQGQDFYGHPLMMERITRTRATTRDATIRLRHVGVNDDRYGKLVLQRVDIIGPTEAKKAERRAKSAAAREAKKPVEKSVEEKPATNGKKPVASVRKVVAPKSKRPVKANA